MSKKTRLDVLLVTRGLQESRQKAQATIMSGLVYVNGQKADKPGPLWRRTPRWRSGAAPCATSAGAG